MKAYEQQRQGDVFLIRVPKSKVSKGHKEEPRTDGKVILAYGEATGHHHRFEDPGVCTLRAEEGGEYERLLQLGKAGGVLKHEEHVAHPAGGGTMRVVIQHEYDFLAEMAVPVVD